MKSLAIVFLVAACTTGTDDFPVQPSSGGPPALTSVGSNNGTTVVVGRVCLVSDPRQLDVCSSTNAGGIRVTVGSVTAITSPDGTFTIPVANSTNLVFTVTGSTIVTSTRAFSPTVVIPAIPTALFDEVLVSNHIVLVPRSGSVFATIERSGVPVSGVVASSVPSPIIGPFFDGITPVNFTLDATGARGVAFFPGVAPGLTSLTFSDLGTAGETTVDGVQVVDGGITFVDAILP